MRKARRGVPDQRQGRVEVDRDALAAEVLGGALDVASQELARRRMHYGIDGLGKVDDHGALVPPEDVEGREVAVHELGIQDPAYIALQLAPDPPRGRDIEVDVGEPGRSLVTIANERHPVAILDALDRRRHRDTGEMQPSERD